MTVNLIPNPILAADAHDWDGLSATVTHRTDEGWAGPRSALVATTATANAGLRVQTKSGLRITGYDRNGLPRRYAGSVVLKGAGVVLDKVRLRAVYTDATFDESPAVAVALGAGYDPVELSGLVVDPAKTVDRFEVRATKDAATAVSFRAGAAQVAEEEQPSAVAAGSFPDSRWLGAANDSPSERTPRAIVTDAPGRDGFVRMVPRLELRGFDDRLIDDVTDLVLSGRVEMDVSRPVKTIFRCTVADVRPFQVLGAFLAPALRLEYSDGTATEYARLGLFALPPFASTATTRHAIGDLVGYDMTWLLGEQNPRSSYTIPDGAPVMRALIDNLDGSGVRWILAETARVARDAFTWSRKETKLAILNELLESVGYYSLWAQPNGRVMSVPYYDLDRLQPAKSWTGGEAHPSRRVLGAIKRNPNPKRLAHRVVVVNDPPGRESIRAEVEITNPNHPLAEHNTRRNRVHVYRSRFVTDAFVADQMARRLLREHAAEFQTVEMTTVPDPRRGVHEVYDLMDLVDQNGEYVVRGRWYCRGWSLGLTPKDGPMKHSLSRLDEWQG